MWQGIVRIQVIVGVIFMAGGASGCMTYQNYPDRPRAVERADLVASADEAFSFAIEGIAIFDGQSGIRDVLQRELPFKYVEERYPDEGIPDEGMHVHARVTSLPPNLAAAVWMYIDASILFLLPAASTQDGYRVTYDLYRDGERQRRETYEFNRATVVWLPMVLIAWVNFITPSEKDAFTATARDFVQRAL